VCQWHYARLNAKAKRRFVARMLTEHGDIVLWDNVHRANSFGSRRQANKRGAKHKPHNLKRIRPEDLPFGKA
jgi:hypothetical protein